MGENSFAFPAPTPDNTGSICHRLPFILSQGKSGYELAGDRKSGLDDSLESLQDLLEGILVGYNRTDVDAVLNYSDCLLVDVSVTENGLDL